MAANAGCAETDVASARTLAQKLHAEVDIKSCVEHGHFRFREGVQQLLSKLSDRKVPVMVFSAGIADVLEEIFAQRLGMHGT